MFILKTPRWNNRHYEYRVSASEDISDIYVSEAVLKKRFGDSIVYTTLSEARGVAGPGSELHTFYFPFPRD